MSAVDKHYKAIDTCLLVIDRESGRILEAAGEYPFSTAGGLEGRDWCDALGLPPDSTTAISQAITAGVAATLPPLIAGDTCEGGFLMSGMLLPQRWQGRSAAVLVLRTLTTPWGLDLERDVGEGDVVAVLGVDRLEFSPAWGMAETEALMMELRSGLSEVLRDGDWLGLPEGTAVTVLMRGLQPEAALDICRALLSHLHQGLAGLGDGAQRARACIGLAQRLQGQRGLSVMVAANTALLQAQAGGDERIRFASPWDPLGQAARALNATGAFQDAGVDSGQREYLSALVGLPDKPRRPANFAASVLLQLLAQRGLAAAALLQVTAAAELRTLASAVVAEGEVRPVAENCLPRSLQSALRSLDQRSLAGSPELAAGLALLPLASAGALQGCLLLQDREPGAPGFRPGAAALQFIATRVAAGVGAAEPGAAGQAPRARGMEKGIEGYVPDNMEGAIDQAVFLARVDMPVAVVGERGTGKMYVAQIIHGAAGGQAEGLVRLDCRSFRNRNEAWTRISRELERGENRSLVFKSPQLLHPDIQARLARLLASRTASDDKGAHYLARNRYLALFPEDIGKLLARGELDSRLASVFAGYPIRVPPLRERPRAVLRWAHKIVEQESTQADRRVSGFTPDAEQALLKHHWPGNISEMRQLIRGALQRTEKEWITPVDLGLFSGISEDGHAAQSRGKPFLSREQAGAEAQPEYCASAQEQLRLALGQSLATSVKTQTLRPLGAWLDDEIVQASLERSGGDARGAAEYLQTRTRNIGRWLPRVREREQEREASLMWQGARECIRQWVLDSAPPKAPPQQLAQDMLMALVLQQCGALSAADRARIMGVSTPTYQKRLKLLLQDV